MNIVSAAAAVAGGRKVSFRPVGSSMQPLVRSGDLVTVEPVKPETLEKGDIVLVRVSGSTYLHLVVGLDHGNQRVQIGNNKGRVNGWASYERVYGIATEVQGRPRPRTQGKTSS